MKKIILVAAVAIFTISGLKAQERDAGDIELTPYIGYSSAFFNGDEVEGLDSRNTVAFGVIGNYFFNDRWSLRSGLEYAPLGSAFGNSELKLDYLNIPINANWHFGSTRKWHLNFGLTPGFLLSADADGVDVKDGVESFQLGVSYGIGYRIEVSDNFSVLIDGQGFFGVTNILAEAEDFTRLNAGSTLSVGGVFKF
ncbi:porin family protein [uncultured Dokdonia sp.]|uniref:porin family protein n=1 Tax=uncultured Dokdonia sp. TaxID=575653 RepID=UPI0026206CB8|nr:porin family protein [uncultured Dokdonia sp.]